MKKRIKNIISYVLLIISGILAGLTLYVMFRFQHISFEQIIYSLLYSKGSSVNAITEGLIVVIVIFIIYFIIILFPFYGKINTKKTKIFPLDKEFFFSYSMYMFTLMFVVSGFYFGLFKYLYYQINTTNIFDYYINPKEVEIKFPTDKKNLIYIFVESLEMSDISIEQGGLMKKSLIPDLEKIAKENTNFSNNDKLGGAVQVDGVGWTMGGMIAQTAGIPLKVLVQGNHYDEYSSFLPGTYSLGEILQKNGYENYLMLGSDASFGGRKQYFEEHGNYQIYDYYWARKKRLFRDDYYEWWGYEDSKLFSYAKERLQDISKKNTPFNFTILTADTHFPNGYIDKSCRNNLPFSKEYENSFFCSNRMIYDFIKWIMEQDFYKNTVIVISGDHLTMQSSLYKTDDKEKRVVYNAFINSDTKTVNNKNRLFTTMDMYPTTLAAMGATISGDKLGLGTNLYSDKKTIVEELGYEYVDKEIAKKSNFYNKYILKDTYKEMYKNVGRNYEEEER